MTKSHLLSAIAASLLVLGMAVFDVQSQQVGPTRGNTYQPASRQPVSRQPASRATSPFALLDVGRVFKEYNYFIALKNTLKDDVKNADEWLKRGRERIKALNEQLRGLEKGSVEYKKLERQIAGEISTVATEAKLQQNTFLETEAKHHDAAYREVQNEVARFAQVNGYIAVFRFSSDPPTESKSSSPDSVLKKINGPVVWHAPGVDITSMVIQSLNKRYQKAILSQNSNKAAGVRSRPPQY